MDDDEDDVMLQNHALIPERDSNGLRGHDMMNNMDMGGLGDRGNYSGDSNMFGHDQAPHVTSSQHLGTQAEAAFNQQRVVVARLSREELEDR